MDPWSTASVGVTEAAVGHEPWALPETSGASRAPAAALREGGPQPARPPLPATPILLLALSVAAMAATVAPLLSYTASLAFFGGAHVLYELRYVEARFGDGRLRRLAVGVGLALAGVVGLRIASIIGLYSGPGSGQIEIALIAALAMMCVPALKDRGGPAAILVGLSVGALCTGLLFDPLLTLVVLAVAHNWTPAFFLAEALPVSERRRGLLLGIVAFGALPLGLASGLPVALAEHLGAGVWLEGLPGSGPIDRHLGVYLPKAWLQADFATALFSAVTYAQLVHYLVVIGVLPRIAPGGPGAPAPIGLTRPSPRLFALLVAVLSLIGVVGYLADFTLARRWYGVIAAVHAWIEVPALLLALAARPRR